MLNMKKQNNFLQLSTNQPLKGKHTKALKFKHFLNVNVDHSSQNNISTLKPPRTSLHSSINPVIILAQIFAVFPVNVMNSSTPYNLRFKWVTWRMIYVFSYITLVAVILCIQIYNLFAYSWSFYELASHVFYLSGAVTSVLCILLAKDWPILMQSWWKVDQVMEKKYGYPKKLGNRFKLATFALMILAVVEHVLSLCYRIHYANIVHNNTINFQKYYSTVYPQIFKHIEPTVPIGLTVEVLLLITSFLWNFKDLIIILLSSALALRFKQLSERLRKNRHETCINYWSEIREDYTRLCGLTRLLDEKVGYLVIHSYASNLLVILAQLFFSLSIIRDKIVKMYFFYSFGFIILRTVAVFLYGAWINDESMEPIHILNALPSACYNAEVRRFLLLMTTEPASLTGCNLFKITRGLILNIAGAIVTYELVLIQFNVRTRTQME